MFGVTETDRVYYREPITPTLVTEKGSCWLGLGRVLCESCESFLFFIVMMLMVIIVVMLAMLIIVMAMQHGDVHDDCDGDGDGDGDDGDYRSDGGLI